MNWGEAKARILNHASLRVRTHTEVGGEDLEIVDSALDEAVEFCIGLATGKHTLPQVAVALNKAADEMARVEEGSENTS